MVLSSEPSEGLSFVWIELVNDCRFTQKVSEYFFRLLSYEILKLIKWIPEVNKGICCKAHLNDWLGAIEVPAICENGINSST